MSRKPGGVLCREPVNGNWGGCRPRPEEGNVRGSGSMYSSGERPIAETFTTSFKRRNNREKHPGNALVQDSILPELLVAQAAH
mmetsp:Transcript_68727/g.129704  ORF Transcript_68727/g.129704 Transcript_68727/m.129704 type:complete len:83 (+) Transcript_68727:467-715(+)